MEITFDWNEELGRARCIIFEGNQGYTGEAFCHEADADVKSEFTGNHIAYLRATRARLQHYKNNIFRPQLAVLYDLRANISSSKNFNENSYENKMINRKISLLEKQLQITKESIAMINKELKEYINHKEKISQYIRMKNKRDEDKSL